MLRINRFYGTNSLNLTSRKLEKIRKYSSQIHFDRNLKKQQKEWSRGQRDWLIAAGGLRNEIEDSLFERFKDLRDTPSNVLILGEYGNLLKGKLQEDFACTVVTSDIAKNSNADFIVDEDNEWPFPQSSFDAIISNMNLHWLNNLEFVCQNVKSSLKEDGVFFGSLLGADTLFELRCSLQLAQQEIENGLSPRISPMISVNDLANLLGNCGFQSITVDCDTWKIHFPDIKTIMKDLQLLGESNALLGRDKLFLTFEIYLLGKPFYGGM